MNAVHKAVDIAYKVVDTVRKEEHTAQNASFATCRSDVCLCFV